MSSRLARLCVRVWRSVSACALPRPSATASAKLANRTVNHSQSTICSSNHRFCPPVMISRTSTAVVSALTISSTNMTGLLISVRGSSLTKAWPIAGTTMAGSNSVVEGVRLRSFEVSMTALRKSEQGIARQGLGDRAQDQRREEGEAAHDQDHADQEPDEQAPRGGKRAARGRYDLLLRERAGDRHRRNDHPEPTDQHRDCTGEIVERR